MKASIPTALLCLFLLSLSWMSCKGPKVVSGENRLSKSELNKRLNEASIPNEWMICSGRVSIRSEEFGGSGTFRMHVQRDSAVWIQLTKLGFEIGRVLITQDSIVAINKLQSTYVAEPIEQMIELYGADIRLEQVQKLIWNLPPFLSENTTVTPSQDRFIVEGQTDGYSQNYVYQILPPFLLAKGKLSTTLPKGTYGIDFSNNDFQKLTNDYLFSYLRNYEVEAPSDKMEIEMKISKVVLDEARPMPIRIPDSYTPLFR